MLRDQLQANGLRLSYLDTGGDGSPLIALHAHWMEAATFAPLAAALAPDWRVIALDQRGHGYSDHAPTYYRDDYVSDLLALLDHLGLAQPVLLGNSLGAVNAYQFAARYPSRARALIIEDIGAEIAADTSFVLAWQGVFASREELAERIGPRLLPYLQDSFRRVVGGWRLAFDPRENQESQNQLNGDHWGHWLASACPALLLHGRDSQLTSLEHLQRMASERPNTRLQTLPGGHVIHVDSPREFTSAVRDFLASLG